MPIELKTFSAPDHCSKKHSGRSICAPSI